MGVVGFRFVLCARCVLDQEHSAVFYERWRSATFKAYSTCSIEKKCRAGVVHRDVTVLLRAFCFFLAALLNRSASSGCCKVEAVWFHAM